MSDPNAKRVEAVERALTILDAFLPEESGLALKDLAARTGLHKSTILRLCGSLEAFGFLSRDRDDGRFWLGAKVCQLGGLYQRTFRLEDHVRPALRSLVAECGETASFYVRDGERRVCLFRENSLAGVRHHVEEGVSLPLDLGAAGAVLLAYASDRVTGGGAMPEAIVAVRTAGHAVSLGARDPDAAAVAAPVFALEGRCAGALALSGLRTRFTEDAQKTLSGLLMREAAALGRRLGAPEPGGEKPAG